MGLPPVRNETLLLSGGHNQAQRQCSPTCVPRLRMGYGPMNSHTSQRHTAFAWRDTRFSFHPRW